MSRACRRLRRASRAGIARTERFARAAAAHAGVDVLVYEGGEGLRFDEFAIKAAVEGVGRIMVSRGMLELPGGDIAQTPAEMRRGPVFADASKWVRAPDGGVFRSARRIGHAVSDGDLLGCVANPYDESEVEVRAPCRGIIIGATTLPIVNMGDALFHIAWAASTSDSASARPGRPI